MKPKIPRRIQNRIQSLVDAAWDAGAADDLGGVGNHPDVPEADAALAKARKNLEKAILDLIKENES